MDLIAMPRSQKGAVLTAGGCGNLRVVVAGLCIGAAALLGGREAARAAPFRPRAPFTYLFDTGSSSPAALSGRSLAAMSNWTLVPEDDLAHRFQGDVILLNDKLTVVLRVHGPGVEIYCPTAAGLKPRAVLVPLPATGRKITGLASVKTVENNPGAVTLLATFATAGGDHASATLRLTTGRSMIEIRPGSATDRLVVWDRPAYVVVPSFFGNDMVFGPERFQCSRHGLPAENFFLNLVAGGEAMVMCVWKSNRRWADVLLLEKDGRREIGGCEIQCARDEPLWVAFMEGPDIWRHQTGRLSADEKGPAILAGRRPFEAKWRVDLLQPGGFAAALDLEGQRQPDDQAVRQIRAMTEGMAPTGIPSVLTYPIDRTRATPLTAFCPTDVLRDTLGVGPCQYILQTEGLASETNPTPANVMDWVEKQFERGKTQEAAQQIRSLLGQMTQHVALAQKKIRRYRQFGHEILLLCTAAGEDKAPPGNPDSLGFTAAEVETCGDLMPSRFQDAAAGEVSREIIALIGKENSLAECHKLAERVREIGAAQDKALSDCRMAVRWLRQKARRSLVADAGRAELAREVFARAERMLKNE
jgi:hypothetical protein